MTPLHHFREVWAVDFEFTAPAGERPTPLCVVARELHTDRLERLWLTEGALELPPYSTGPDRLFVAYYASAEGGCHLALDWPLPARILDLYAEFRCLTSGLPVPCGYGLLGALAYYGLDGLAVTEKDTMRQLAMRGGPYTPAEQVALLDYCQTDVDALARLLPVMLPRIDLPRALLRGRYMAAAARMEWTGVPIDREILERLRGNWDQIKGRLIAELDRDFGVFVPAGQRTIDPESRLGNAILREAEHYGIDPHHLADAVNQVWTEERAAIAETRAGLREASNRTGLTPGRIDQWEDSGRDYSLFPNLDSTAQELAGEFPELGIGPGYTSTGSAADDIDSAAALWQLLRQGERPTLPKHHPTLLQRAAEMVAACPAEARNTFEPMKFSTSHFGDYLARKGIPWPRLESGALALDDDTFREMGRAYTADVAPIRELRHALSQMRLNELAVGSDVRNRVILSAFGSRSSRNQPSNSRYIFGPSCWLRSLIRPGPGRALAYVDWEQQEFGIGAALAGDRNMQEAYRSGDPYLTFAKQAGAVPAAATKESHKGQRDLFKLCALGVQYGMQAESLARRSGQSVADARELLQLHRRTYARYWEWSDAVQDFAMLHGWLSTVFGWRLHVGRDVNPRALRNFPLQANGAEMLRLACCLATERGVAVCAPVHDALLIEGPADDIGHEVARTQEAMREASELVLPGFPLRTDAKIVRYPDRYQDERGRKMWATVCSIMDTVDGLGTPTTGGRGPLPPVVPPPSLISLSY